MEQIYHISRAATELFRAHAELCERIRTPRNVDAYGIQVSAFDDNGIGVTWAHCVAKSTPRVVRSEGGYISLEYAFFVDVHLETICIGAIYMDAEGGFWLDAEMTTQVFYSSTVDALGKSIAKKILDSVALAPLRFAPTEQ